jgi:hypothetical protein
MSYELISEEEYANLPDEDDRCFVKFESICRRNATLRSTKTRQLISIRLFVSNTWRPSPL